MKYAIVRLTAIVHTHSPRTDAPLALHPPST